MYTSNTQLDNTSMIYRKLNVAEDFKIYPKNEFWK